MNLKALLTTAVQSEDLTDFKNVMFMLGFNPFLGRSVKIVFP